ncbi:MAG TPA: dehydrogenase, partial [Verrucomicrobiales bacterium]|nr:dehydrogenase [Verrucomicrobiales bacterium]
MNARLAVLVMLLPGIGIASAQQGDRRGEVQLALPEHWRMPPAPVLSPEEELETFKLAESSHVIELFASEPMVQDPVAMEFDADGCLWVVEMRGYNRRPRV